MQTLASYLYGLYEEVSPYDFYADIFSSRALDEAEAFTPGKYVAIACDVTDKKYLKTIVDSKGEERKVERSVVKRYSICRDLDELDYLLSSDSGRCFMAPVSYAGKSKTNDNARFMYAVVVELDSLRTVKDAKGNEVLEGITNLLYQFKNKTLPTPTYIVSSGTGIHLYYVLEKALPLYDNVQASLKNWRREFTFKLWNRYVTTLFKDSDIQYEAVCQAFRIVGTKCKNKIDIARAFKVGNKVSVAYLNEFVTEKNFIEDAYRSELPLKEAQEKYPEWYSRRIVNKKPRNSWTCHRGLYDWWLNKITYEAVVGHRFYCIMILSIYAIKCDISYDELEEDAFSLLERFDSLSETDRFTEEDVLTALSIYFDKNFVTYPISAISYRSGLVIHKNKRNYRKRADHIKIMNFMRDVVNCNTTWNKVGNGRKPKKDIVQEWRKNNPEGKKADCIRETGLSKPTVYKWWEIS